MKFKDILALIMKNKILLVILLLVAAFIIIRYTGEVKNAYYDDSIISDIEQVDAVGQIPNRVTLDQGEKWDDSQRQAYWYTSQGSEMIPYKWLMWLEQEKNQELFRSADFIESIGYLPSPSSSLNPGGLPIGFTIQRPRKNKQQWMGFNCAACHTNQIDYQGTKMMIEGAPTLANFKILYDEMIKSMIATAKQDDKFNRFATKILGDGYNVEDGKELKQQLTNVYKAAAKRQAVNALPHPEFPEDFAGYARVDAFGQIANAATAFALNDLTNNNPPSGPVSYPFLWGTHQSNVVQWNASAPNIPIVGPLVRNVGEVVGVFGGMDIEESPWWQQLLGVSVQYSSTVDYEGIGLIEKWIKEMQSPQWPEHILPEIDEEKAARGGILFEAECQSCHQVIPRDKEFDLYTAVKTPLSLVGTDPMMAYNAGNGTGKTLILEGQKENVVAGAVLEEEAGATSILVNGIIGVMLKRPKKALAAGKMPSGDTGTLKDIEKYLLELEKAKKEHMDDYVHPHDTLIAPNALGPSGPNLDLKGLVYKARPLNGIWATAPYLHNGSVPNLWELLQSPKDRTTSFKVGSREFDATHVGFVSDQGPGTFNVMRADSTIIPGNSNLGHHYGHEFSDDQKWALVEYMKTL